MSIVETVVVFAIVWWLFFFMLLPWGVERNDAPEKGHDAGAPVRPMLWRKALATSVLAAAATAVIRWVVESYLGNF
ncbi:MAG: DUF1467 family protein [Rhodospirillaceae bacterium]|nr:DUF1467 family protein [Rhodospirillaceae bacterium]